MCSAFYKEYTSNPCVNSHMCKAGIYMYGTAIVYVVVSQDKLMQVWDETLTNAAISAIACYVMQYISASNTTVIYV